ncbi:MAG TPA: T9SS type A sorting domain-containing protein [Saprospiraceae bacterium]|nr:T9SS type A sorting domain-containing protein [Saprospiraceae bacterium]
MLRWNALLLLLLCFALSHASSILPYQSLAILADHSDAVGLYYVQDFTAVNHGDITYLEYCLKPQHAIKGPQNQLLIVQCLSKIYAEGEFAVPDDLNLEKGNTYLLFLNQRTNGYYQAKTFNYYVFKQVLKDGRELLLPSKETLEIKGNATRKIEEFSVLDRKTLVSHLTDVLTGKITYDPQIVKAPSRYSTLDARDAPSYCTYFGLRWDVFDGGGSLPVYADETPDQFNPGCYDFLQNAIAGINSGYNNNVILGYSGTTGLSSNSCNGGFDPSIQGLDPESILVVFNDPCDQVSDFDCDASDGMIGGSLGIGGIYAASGIHSFNGENWYTAEYGYVVINDGLSCFNNSTDWQSLLMHEMTHALGLGHISSSNGTALMNPSCCNPITELDQDCVSFAYDAALPVQLIAFDAFLEEDWIAIDWRTSWEVNHDYFEVLHSADGQNWKVIDQNIQESTSNENQKQYQTVDRNPVIGTNYYRLNQVDIDGKSELSPIVQVKYYPKQWARISPNPVEGNLLTLEFTSQSIQRWEIEVFDVTGNIRKTFSFAGANRYVKSQIDISMLSPGVYFIRFPKQGAMQALRFIKT